MMPKHCAFAVSGILAFSAYYTTINFASVSQTYFKYKKRYLGGGKMSVIQVLGLIPLKQ
jgi:hypothetical protein